MAAAPYVGYFRMEGHEGLLIRSAADPSRTLQRFGLGESEDQRSSGGGDERVLVLHRGLLKWRTECPAIIPFLHPIRAERQEGLDGEDQTLGDRAPVPRLVPSRDCGGLVMQ